MLDGSQQPTHHQQHRPGPFAGQSPDAIFHRIVEVGEEWAEADKAARLLEDLTKSRLAQLTLREQARGVSRVQAETEALASDAYQEHVRSGIQAREHASKLQVRHKAALMWVELWRSLNANQRAEMRLGGVVS